MFLQAGHSCLETLDHLSLMAQDWATQIFKAVWSLFPLRTGAICTGEMLSIKESASLGDTEVGMCSHLSVPKAGICCFPGLSNLGGGVGDGWGKGWGLVREKGEPL